MLGVKLAMMYVCFPQTVTRPRDVRRARSSLCPPEKVGSAAFLLLIHGRNFVSGSPGPRSPECSCERYRETRRQGNIIVTGSTDGGFWSRT